ncbi:MAG: hypothetical protein ACT6TH_11495 [Brevundimonas sp.]|uniref:hypothetical protein n=1 Tax=Brevundimonas sp. TaxID=1871086 RepID=UPI0040341C60
MTSFDSVRAHDFSPDRCFLCATALTGDSRSEEHVFPRWLQKQFGIRDRKLELLNRVPVAYRKLTIPCCRTCNNGVLANLERRVQKHLLGSPANLSVEARTDLFLWTSKILFGLLYKQTSVSLDPAHRSGPTILDRTDMRQFSYLHMYLQGIRKGFQYWGETPLPATLFVYDVECPIDPYYHFDWHDIPATSAIYLRLGHKGIVMCLDGGAQEIAVGNLLRRYQHRTLHPLQFEEIGAKVLYKSTIATRSAFISFLDGAKLFCSHLGFDYPEAPIFYSTTRLDEDRTQIVTIPNPLDDGRPLFGDWDKADYAERFSRMTGIPVEQLLTEDGTGATWLIDLDDRDIVFSLETVPYRGQCGSLPRAPGA